MRKLPRKIKVLLIIFGLVAVVYAIRPMSNSQMTAHFRKHKGEFEQLRQMLKQDKNVATIGDRWTRAKYGPDKVQSPENKKLGIVTLHELPLGITTPRIELYRSRLKSIGAGRIDSYDDGRVQIAFYGGGVGDKTWSRGYLWSTEKPRLLKNSAYYQSSKRKDMLLIPIEDNWFIFLRR